MAQIISNSSGINNLNISDLQSRINTIRSRLNTNKTIRAQDVSELIYIYNQWITHTHVVTDYSFIAYGDTPTQGTAVTSHSTNTISAGAASDILAGSTIDANRIRSLGNLINAIRSHNHVLADNEVLVPGCVISPKRGLTPTGWNASVHGDAIWPTNLYGGAGWLFTTITPIGSRIYLQFQADDYFYCYVNGVNVLNQHQTSYSWTTAWVNVTPGVPIEIKFKVGNIKRGFQLIGLVQDETGPILTKTSIYWSSAY